MRSCLMGRRFPKENLFFEHQCASISDALPAEQCYVTTKNAAGGAKERHRFTNLHLDARAGQQPPIRFDERAA